LEKRKNDALFLLVCLYHGMRCVLYQVCSILYFQYFDLAFRFWDTYKKDVAFSHEVCLSRQRHDTSGSA